MFRRGAILVYILLTLSAIFSTLVIYMLSGKMVRILFSNNIDRYIVLYEGISISRMIIETFSNPVLRSSAPLKFPQSFKMNISSRHYLIYIDAEDALLPIRYPFIKVQFLENLFIHLGIPKDKAQKLANSLADFQDPDELKRIGGAESEYYKRFGYSPPNKPLQSLQEIIWVKEIDYELYKRIKNYISVYTRDININFAKPEVLKALGFSEEKVNLLLAIRENRYINFSDLRTLLGKDFNVYIKYFNLLPIPTIYRVKIYEEKSGEVFYIILNQYGEVIDVLWF